MTKTDYVSKAQQLKLQDSFKHAPKSELQAAEEQRVAFLMFPSLPAGQPPSFQKLLENCVVHFVADDTWRQAIIYRVGNVLVLDMVYDSVMVMWDSKRPILRVNSREHLKLGLAYLVPDDPKYAVFNAAACEQLL